MKYFKPIWILAVLSTREWIRLKFFYLVVFFGVIFIAFSRLLSSLSFSVQERILYDFGLAGLEIGLIMIASMIGSHSIQREIDRKTLLVMLARAIPRSYILIGSWVSILFLCLIFGAGFIVSLLYSSDESKYIFGLLISSYSAFLKVMVISSFSIAFGILVRPILALGISVLYWILCYSMPEIKFFVSKLEDEFLLKVYFIFEKMLPQFYLYNWKSYYYIKNPPLLTEVAWATTHSLAWSFLWLIVGVMVFKRKEIA